MNGASLSFICLEFVLTLVRVYQSLNLFEFLIKEQIVKCNDDLLIVFLITYLSIMFIVSTKGISFT